MRLPVQAEATEITAECDCRHKASAAKKESRPVRSSRDHQEDSPGPETPQNPEVLRQSGDRHAAEIVSCQPEPTRVDFMSMKSTMLQARAGRHHRV